MTTETFHYSPSLLVFITDLLLLLLLYSHHGFIAVQLASRTMASMLVSGVFILITTTP